MSQNTEVAKVKARIRALTEKTISNGCTEAEALAAAEMVGRLLEQYALTMEDVDIRSALCVESRIPLRGVRRRPIDASVPAIARFCDCKVWLTREPTHCSYVFFGFEEDTLLARYLYEVVERGMRGELQAYRAAHPALRGTALRRASESYQRGMAVRVADRLEEMRTQRHQDVSSQRSSGMALVLLKDHAVDEAFRASKVRLVSARRPSVRPDSAYGAGYQAGERINLRRPLRGGGQDYLP